MVDEAVSRIEDESFPERVSHESRVYTLIKNAILKKELKPGEKVSHLEWAQRLNISRTPVRDALKRLENEGLVIRETERQWHVYTLTLPEVLRIFDARETVDAEVAALAAKNISEPECVQLEQILADMVSAGYAQDYETFYSLNTDFHKLLEQASGNEYLSQFSSMLNQRLSRLYPKGINIDGRLEKGVIENRKIAHAVLTHNCQAAAESQQEHIRSYRNHLVRVLQEMVIPFAGPEF